MNSCFNAYDLHYARMSNVEPNWELAEQHPAENACKQPWLPTNRRARILDFGCGWGHQLLSLWCAGYKNLEGVELTSRQADVAIRCAGNRVPITCMDGREYVADKESAYDLVILNDVFEHIPPAEAPALLTLLKRALRPHGILVIRVPNMANLFAAYSRYLDITHVAGYTEYSLMQLLDQAGFADHSLVLPTWTIDFRRWRPWLPWRGLMLRSRFDYLLHKLLYWLRGHTAPRCFAHNVEIYTRKPDCELRKHAA